ncbi:MAG TPA: PQQ-binding-like beta-propeller repeat protein [Gemmataceae bacterium]|nr:PQQ-binding-like beta-propeller repeat protein [Gemmataceae bacterium]
MCRLPLLVYEIGFVWLLPLAIGAETDPEALPPGAVVRIGWSPLRNGYADFVLTPDGRTIVVVTEQGNLRRLDAQTGRLLERRQLTDRGDVDPVRGSFARLSANGQIVAITERSYTGPRLTAYDIASGKQIFRREFTEKNILLSRLSVDGKQLAVVEAENANVGPERVRVFNLKQGRTRELGKFDYSITGLHFSEDGKRLLIVQCIPELTTGSTISFINRHTIINIDLSSGKELWRRTVWGANFAIGRDGKMVIGFGFRDRKSREPGFHVMEMNGGAAKPTERFVPCRLVTAQSDYDTFNYTVFALAPDDRTIALRRSKEIVLWDLRDRKVTKHFRLSKTSDSSFTLTKMAISSDQRKLLFVTRAGYLQRLDLTTGKRSFVLPDNGLPSPFLDLAFTPDGKEIFASAYGGIAGRWNATTGKRTDMIRGENAASSPFIRTPHGLRVLRYEYRQRHVAFGVFDPIAQKMLHTIPCIDIIQLPPEVPSSNPQTYALTANAKTILAIHSDTKKNYVTARNAVSEELLSCFTVPAGIDWPRSPFSPCGRWVVLGGKLYHVGSGTELFAPAGRRGERLSGEPLMDGNQKAHGPVWFSDDSRFMAAHLRKKDAKSAAEDALAVWELASGQVLARFAKCGFVAHVAFAPDGRTIALLDGRGVRLMDLLTQKPLTAYSAPDAVCGGTKQGLDFAPDGATLATAHDDGSILLWKVPRSRPAHGPALPDGEAEKLWKDLGSSAAAAARAALERLDCHPASATKLLARRFRLPPVDGTIAALIKNLDDDEFTTREEASRKLRAYGAGAESALRRVLAQKPSLEMKRRIEGILAEIAPVLPRIPLQGERLRGVRAIEVLERLGNAAARKLLHSWAEQTQDVPLAVEARMALERLEAANAESRAPRKRQLP